MIRTLTPLLSVAWLLAISANPMRGQAPTPIIVQAASATAPAAATPAPMVKASQSTDAQMKILREMQAANDEILKKQEATFQQLDELQKAADQLKIFGKRG
jgi:hypothetical protein